MKAEYLGFGALALVIVGGLLFSKWAGGGVEPASAPEPVVITHGMLTIDEIWVAETLGTQDRTAAYMRVANSSNVDDRLVAVSSPQAAMAHLHQTVTEDNVSRMEGIDALIIPGGATLSMRPGGIHIMLMSVTGPLEAGDELELTLGFLEAGDVTFTAPVRGRREMMEHMGH